MASRTYVPDIHVHASLQCSHASVGLAQARPNKCWSSHPAPGIVNNCPSRWIDLTSAILVTWAAPERPNGVLLQYHLQLTTYDGRRVIVTESVGSSTFLDDLDSNELREFQHNCGFCSFRDLVVITVYSTYTPPTFTENGVPYTVRIFAENSAGNGTKCNVTDFTDELCKFYKAT